jgi:hypothetical protein
MKQLPYSFMIVRSKTIPIVLIFMVFAIGALSSLPTQAKIHVEAKGAYFRSGSGDLHAIAIRPHGLSKEVKDDSSRNGPHPSGGSLQNRILFTHVTSSKALSSPEFYLLTHLSLFLRHRVIRI